MKLSLGIKIDVDDDDEDTAERVADIAQEEARKFAAALADRLEAEGVTNVQIDLGDDDGGTAEG